MSKQLFFDDCGLFVRENVVRRYGSPELVSTVHDPVCRPVFPSSSVFRLDDGRYRWILTATGKDFNGRKIFSYISEDGIHFTPEDLRGLRRYDNVDYDHEIRFSDRITGGELCAVYEDKACDPVRRYKLLFSTESYSRLWVQTLVFTSPDLIHWEELDGASWGETEPCVSVFYNRHTGQHTIVQRPFWCLRQIGYRTTRNWKDFSPFRYCVTPDSLDEPLTEIYGMCAFEYDGMYIGLPHLYRHMHNEYNAKYNNGCVDTQLAYSYDGEYWKRSLREPFISGIREGEEKRRPITWVFGTGRAENGDMLFYGTAAELEHGPVFREDVYAELQVHRLRKDGFVLLATEDDSRPSAIATREKIWQGGELHINLKARSATLEVRIAEEDDPDSPNLLGFSKPVGGYRHEDCIPFSGDSTDWTPRFKSGNTLSALAGKVLIFEIRFTSGEIYSLAGSCTDVFNIHAARYRKFGAQAIPQDYVWSPDPQ